MTKWGDDDNIVAKEKVTRSKKKKLSVILVKWLTN